jgi:hypothetical protein
MGLKNELFDGGAGTSVKTTTGMPVRVAAEVEQNFYYRMGKSMNETHENRRHHSGEPMAPNQYQPGLPR